MDVLSLDVPLYEQMLLSEICWFQKESVYNLCLAVQTCVDHHPGSFIIGCQVF